MAEEVRQPRAIGVMMSVETLRSSEGSVPKRHLPELSLLGVESILVLVMRAVTSRNPLPLTSHPIHLPHTRPLFILSLPITFHKLSLQRFAV